VHFRWKACFTDMLFNVLHTPSVLFVDSKCKIDFSEDIYLLEYHAFSTLLGLLTLNMKALRSFETSVTMYQYTRRKNSEDLNLETLKS
jgi:hypothetical protein